MSQLVINIETLDQTSENISSIWYLADELPFIKSDLLEIFNIDNPIYRLPASKGDGDKAQMLQKVLMVHNIQERIFEGISISDNINRDRDRPSNERLYTEFAFSKEIAYEKFGESIVSFWLEEGWLKEVKPVFLSEEEQSTIRFLLDFYDENEPGKPSPRTSKGLRGLKEKFPLVPPAPKSKKPAPEFDDE